MSMKFNVFQKYIREISLKRNRRAVEQLACRIANRLGAKCLVGMGNELNSRVRVSIISPSDAEHNLYRQLQWGDYWAKYELIKAIGELGFLVTDISPDVVVHLFGAPVELPRDAYKIAWIYSHPDKVDLKVLSRYDRVYCLSSQFTNKIRSMGFEAEWAPGATCRIPKQCKNEYDVVFVGNNRGPDRLSMKVLADLPYKVQVWGAWWEGVLPEHCIGGQYVDYPNLSDLYASSTISLNSHWPEMNDNGFVALRVFDILASGGFCISDANAGIEEIFGKTVPQYRSEQELRELISFYMSHEDERLRCKLHAQKIVQKYTWKLRAHQLLAGLDVAIA